MGIVKKMMTNQMFFVSIFKAKLDIQEYPSFPKTQTQSTFNDKNEKLAAELRNFLAVNNGRASTNEILSRFKVFLF